MTRSALVLGVISLLMGAGAAMAQPAGEPPRTYLFLYAESPATALYGREHGSPYRHEPWMSDAAWEGFWANTQASYPRLLELLGTLQPDIYYGSANSNYSLLGMTAEDFPTVAQIEAQIEAQRAELAEYAAQGVDDVGFYRCAISTRGNPEARHGIFRLYDRWEEYAEVFDLGPKPPEDPMQWLQIRFDSGTPYIRAWDKPDAGGNIGYFCCPNNPYWRQFTDAMVRVGGRIGYTNLFVDNPSLFCKCDWCRRAFPEHLARRYPPEQWRALFPDIAVEQADIEDPRLAVERDRFWQESMGEHLAAMKAALQSQHPGRTVTLSANGSQMTLGPWYTSRANLMQYARAGVDLGFKESPYEFSGVNLRPVGGGLMAVEPGIAWDCYRLVRGTGVDGYYACPAQSYTNPANHPTFYRLAMSEALAMDGAWLDGAPLGSGVDSRPGMYAWLRAHREFFAAGQSMARVAVIVGASEYYFDAGFHADATRDANAIRDWLADQQIPFDYLADEAATPERLARYDLVIVPGFRSLDDGAAQAVAAWTRAGGALVLSGPVGTWHTAGVERAQPVFAALLEGANEEGGLQVAQVGEGRVVACPRRFADADLPDGFSTTDYAVARPQTAGGKTRGPLLPVSVEANRGLFLRALDLAAGRDLSVVRNTDLPGLRVAGRGRIDVEDPWLAVHIINEQMPLRFDDAKSAFDLTADGEPVTYADVRLVIPLPEGYRARGVRWAQVPLSEPQPLAFTTVAEGIECTLPAVELYSVVMVELEAGGLPASPTPATQTPHASQGLYLADPNAPELLPVAGAETVTPELPLRLNFGHPALLRAEAGETVSLQIAAYGPPGKWARWWAASPGGALVATGAVECGQTIEASFGAETPGVYLVSAQADANDVAIASSSHGVCFPATPAQRVNVRGACPELYFRVPEGCTEIPLMLQTRDREGAYEIVDSQGRVAARRDGLGKAIVMDPGGAMVWTETAAGAHYQLVTVPVPDGEAGTVWRLRFLASKPDSEFMSNFYFAEGFPGMVATSPSALLMPAR